MKNQSLFFIKQGSFLEAKENNELKKQKMRRRKSLAEDSRVPKIFLFIDEKLGNYLPKCFPV